MEAFSGYVAVDELYDNESKCVLSLVDNHRHRRLLYEVMDHSPKHEDIIRFLTRFKTELEKRGKKLFGITTDGSNLYPEPLKQVFPGIPHQICIFHLIKEINRAILKVVATVRWEIRAEIPAVGKGRPTTKKAKAASRKKNRLEAKITSLFDNRHHFVRRKLTEVQRKTLTKMTRGLPLLKVLRTIVEEVYRLFDRRCKLATALKKLAALRKKVRRFKKLYRTLSKLFTPGLEKGLTYLDEKLLPATSNSVERSNRRFRKMQRAVYRVRSIYRIRERIALDMMREDRLLARAATIGILRMARSTGDSIGVHGYG